MHTHTDTISLQGSESCRTPQIHSKLSTSMKQRIQRQHVPTQLWPERQTRRRLAATVKVWLQTSVYTDSYPKAPFHHQWGCSSSALTAGHIEKQDGESGWPSKALASAAPMYVSTHCDETCLAPYFCWPSSSSITCTCKDLQCIACNDRELKMPYRILTRCEGYLRCHSRVFFLSWEQLYARLL